MSTGKATGAIDAAAAVALLAMALPACALLAEAIPVSAALEAFRAAALLATERRARFRDDRRALATELRVLSFAGFLVALSPSAASMLSFWVHDLVLSFPSVLFPSESSLFFDL